MTEHEHKWRHGVVYLRAFVILKAVIGCVSAVAEAYLHGHRAIKRVFNIRFYSERFELRDARDINIPILGDIRFLAHIRVRRRKIVALKHPAVGRESGIKDGNNRHIIDGVQCFKHLIHR